MDQFKRQSFTKYYEVLGLDTDASPDVIRASYKKLAMKWHPDKCSFKDRAEAKRMFQEIQEAYAVLSDRKRKWLYDCGLYNPDDDDEDVEGMSSFLDEMTGMMGRVQNSQGPGVGNSLKDLQDLFLSMFGADLAALGNPNPPQTSTLNFERKRNWGTSGVDASYFGSYFMEGSFSSASFSSHFLNDGFYAKSDFEGVPKKSKCAANGLSPSGDIGVRYQGSKCVPSFHANTCSNHVCRNMQDTRYNGSATSNDV